MDEWVRETIEAIGWAIHDRLEKAGPDDVPGWLEMEAESNDCRFQVTVKFVPLPDMPENELNELFGIEGGKQ